MQWFLESGPAKYIILESLLVNWVLIYRVSTVWSSLKTLNINQLTSLVGVFGWTFLGSWLESYTGLFVLLGIEHYKF